MKTIPFPAPGDEAGHERPADIRAEIHRIEQALRRLRLAAAAPQGEMLERMARAELDLVSGARRIIHRRRRRAELFGADLFTEPAWEILLDLFVAGETQARASISSLCVATGLPSMTVIRWVDAMSTHGLVRRGRSAEDARRSHVELSPEAHEKMRRYIRDAITG